MAGAPGQTAAESCGNGQFRTRAIAMELLTATMPVSLLAPIEALYRWHTAGGGLCGPGAFIASIENDFYLAVDLTSQVIHSVSRELGSFLV